MSAVPDWLERVRDVLRANDNQKLEANCETCGAHTTGWGSYLICPYCHKVQCIPCVEKCLSGEAL